jgi:hypothetical protein
MIIGTTNLVINEIGAVFNVRIEGDTDANLFYTDATNSRVGVGTVGPTEKLDVVGGNIRINNGNLVIGTSGKGIDFSITSSGTGTMTSELLADYEEGTWTPIDSSGNSLTFAGVSAYYTKIGDMVFATFTLTYPASASSFTNVIGGLPFTTATGSDMNGFHVAYTNYTPGLMAPLNANATSFTLYDTTTTNAINNTALVSKLIRGTCIYKVA